MLFQNSNSIYAISIRWKSIQKYSNMDLEWLLPQQLEQILKFCELSAVEDLSVAANILESNHWDLEKAMNDVVNQNDQMTKKEQEKSLGPVSVPSAHLDFHEASDYDGREESGEFEMDPQDYRQLIEQTEVPQKPAVSEHSTILAQQNYDYDEVQRKMVEQKEEERLLENRRREIEEEFSKGQQQFEQRKVAHPFAIKFRLAHKSAQFNFDRADKVETMFRYVGSCLRDGFQNRYASFDLTQSFPTLSLQNRKGQTLNQVFEDSAGQLLIVREY